MQALKRHETRTTTVAEPSTLNAKSSVHVAAAKNAADSRSLWLTMSMRYKLIQITTHEAQVMSEHQRSIHCETEYGDCWGSHLMTLPGRFAPANMNAFANGFESPTA